MVLAPIDRPYSYPEITVTLGVRSQGDMPHGIIKLKKRIKLLQEIEIRITIIVVVKVIISLIIID